MDRLIYASLCAMRGAMARQTAIAHNLANSATPGFRGDLAEAQARWIDGATHSSRASMVEGVVAADMHAGAIMETGRALDVAIDGPALFVVQAEDGEEAYTRRGDFQVASSGLLTTGDGHPVLGEEGPINLPPAQSVIIGPQGNVSVVPIGGEPGVTQEIGRLRLVAGKDAEIVKKLDGLFRKQDGATLPDDPDARVMSGKLEGSNVNAPAALVAMIEAGRAWDLQLKLISDARENDSATADLMRLPN